MNNTNQDNKSKLTLTLDPKLSAKISGGIMTKSVPGAQSAGKTVTVEVKKNRSRNAEDKKTESRMAANSEYAADASLTASELNARMSALKHAGQVNEDSLLNKKSKLLRIEQPIIEEESLINSDSGENIDNAQSETNNDNQVDSTPTPSTNETQLTKDKNLDIDDDFENKKKKNVPVVNNDKLKKAPDIKLNTASPKTKLEETARKVKRIDFRSLNDDDEQQTRTRSLSSIKRAREKAKRQEFEKPTEKIVREVILPEIITIQELAQRMAEKSSDVVKELFKLGMMVTVTQSIDADTAELIIDTFGHKFKRVTEADIENILLDVNDNIEDLLPRSAVVTVMGHVDHGKTSLLDALKSTDIASREAGGITQHIGAYQVNVDNDHHVTFLDTPGHEAFTAMRSRGAKVTDIVVLVVAADDGIMAQTVEAINHAKAANVPIIVAINKIDKPEADIDRVKNELLIHELVAEDFGGEIITVPVSAKQRINLDKLIEAILLQAEVLELKANPNRDAAGIVIESKIDKGKGVVATFLVQKGSLKVGDIVVAGATSGKVRAMYNDKGKETKIAAPSTPVEVIGLETAPVAGDTFSVVKTDKQARDISSYRERKMREIKSNISSRMGNLHDVFSRSADGKMKELPVIIKGDVHGSIEAIATSLQKIENNEVKVRILHSAVGAISESDVSLAQASGAIILGFNVRTSSTAKQIADRDKVDIRYYSIIYNLLDDVKLALTGMLSPIIREQYIGNAEIRQVFNVTKFGKIAGCYVTVGIIKRGAGTRLLRDNIVIHEGKLKTLRRFKDDVREVKESFECGVAFENYEDIKVGDIIEAFEIIQEQQKL